MSATDDLKRYRLFSIVTKTIVQILSCYVWETNTASWALIPIVVPSRYRSEPFRPLVLGLASAGKADEASIHFENKTMDQETTLFFLAKKVFNFVVPPTLRQILLLFGFLFVWNPITV